MTPPRIGRRPAPAPAPPVVELPDPVADAIAATFAQPRGVRAPGTPHVLFVDGKRVQTVSGKHVWPNHGAALLALLAHVRDLCDRAARGASDAVPGLARPREPGRVWRATIAPPRSIVNALITSGRVRIVPASDA